VSEVLEHNDDEDGTARKHHCRCCGRTVEHEETPPDRLPESQKRPNRLPAVKALLDVIGLVIRVLPWLPFDW
jgi:hypothetical protein